MINFARQIFLVAFCIISFSSKGQQNFQSFSSVPDSEKPKPFLIFSEKRENPIKWDDSLLARWLTPGSRHFNASAHPNEYFVFQVGVSGFENALQNVQVVFSDLKNEKGNIISKHQFTCFNLSGIDDKGKAFSKRVSVPANHLQPLWIGINIPLQAKGNYQGKIVVNANGKTQVMPLTISVGGTVAKDHGFDKGKNLSRLAWLNSTVGINNKITKGYLPVEREGNSIRILGREIRIAPNGLPEAINTYFTPSNQSIGNRSEPIIHKPFQFIIEKMDGNIIRLHPGPIIFNKESESAVSWQVNNVSRECDLLCTGRVEFDGFVSYKLKLTAKQQIQVKDIRLEVPMEKEKAVYMMGLNRYGGFRPEKWDWQWDTTRNQDLLWVGNVNGGIRFKFLAENYRRPLVNIYYEFGRLHLPPSWGNDNKGGVQIAEGQDDVTINAYSGSREMEKGKVLNYDMEMLITPVKPINKEVQFGDRYFHKAYIRGADSLGANIINIHHGQEIYPFINYPYADENLPDLKKFIDDAHADHKRAKLYYTTRELTINMPELWAFKSLGGEIIFPGPGDSSKTLIHPNGPDPWLQKNLRGNYLPAWVHQFTEGKYKGKQDLSIITTPDSRMNNFYNAGLDWMVKHLGIDGIYIDDVALDRFSLRRSRKILDAAKSNARIDLHSWNHFNKYAGFANSLNLYMDLLPYIDMVWIGEGRDYNLPPDNWLVEVCGIPYGVPGQLLFGGDYCWQGMVYGITNRGGYGPNPPDAIWKFWDKYKIQQKEMIGYWDKNCPVKCSNPLIKATVYRGADDLIISVANWSEADEETELIFNWEKNGLNQNDFDVTLPEIPDFQEQKKNLSLKKLVVPAKKGYLILLQKKKRVG